MMRDKKLPKGLASIIILLSIIIKVKYNHNYEAVPHKCFSFCLKSDNTVSFV